jgi:iron-regulated transporter 1
MSTQKITLTRTSPLGIVVVSENVETPLRDLNATLRRIDLICKLTAPVFISAIDAYSATTATIVVMVMSSCSSIIEYAAITRVYQALPALSNQHSPPEGLVSEPEASLKGSWQYWKSGFTEHIGPWRDYCTSPVFLASFSLSLLYLTVLSTGVQYQTCEL